MSETNAKTVKKIKKVVSKPNFIGVDLSKGESVGTVNGEVVNICKAEFVGMGTVKENFTTNSIALKKVKKIVKKEQTYYIHRCGYDYVVDTINADVVFSGTKDECDDWMKEHSIVEGLNSESSDFGDFEDSYDEEF